MSESPGAATVTQPTATSPLPTLPDGVVANIHRLSPRRADRVLSHVTTAAYLIPLIGSADPNVRLSESVAYNLREALDSVVNEAGAGGGGLGAVHDAWSAVETAEQESQDTTDAVARLHAVIKASTDRKEREGFRSRQLLQQILSSTGVEPFFESGSMVARFNKLRARAGRSLHSSLTADQAADLYRDTVDWLSWMFLPPTQRADEIGALAAETYTNEHQLRRLRELCANPLQLGRFLSLVTDPGWLEPLHATGRIGLPTPGAAVWPVDQLGIVRSNPAAAAKLMVTLQKDLKQHPVVAERPLMALSLFRVSSRLGSAGLPVLNKLLNAYGPTNQGIQVLAVHSIHRCDPAEQIVEQVTQLVLQPQEQQTGRDSHVVAALTALVNGLTAENMQRRVTLTAHGLESIAAARTYSPIDGVPFSVSPQRGRDVRRQVAHRLIGLADRARQLSATTTQILGWVSPITGDLGGRVRSQLLATATDVQFNDRVAHVATRILSDPTGDDRDLVTAILDEASTGARADAIAEWTQALGHPHPDARPADPKSMVDEEARVWRWTGVLPDECFEQWTERLAPLISEHGPADPRRFDIPKEQLHWRFPDQSPISSDELAALSAQDAAARVAQWTPTADTTNPEEARCDLAHAFGRAAEQQLDQWVEESETIVTTLDAARPVTRYLQVVAMSREIVTGHAAAVLAAVTAAAAKLRDNAWPDAQQEEPLRTTLLGHVADLIVKLANTENTPLTAETTALLWAHATEQALATPPNSYVRDDGFTDDQTPYTAAINRPWGQNLEAVLALAARAYRDTNRDSNAAPADLPAVLDEVAAIDGAAGEELHAVLVNRLPLLDTLTPEWVDKHTDYLTPDTPAGNNALAAMVARNQPTIRLLTRYRDRLLTIANTHPEPVVYWLLAASFWQHPGYTIDNLITAVGSNETAAGELCQQTAFLVQDAPPDSANLATAITHWRAFLNSDHIPAVALHKLGHWAFVTNIDAGQWTALMRDTVTRTGGPIDNVVEISERWKTDHNAIDALPLLQQTLGHGNPWEQATVLETAADCLRAAAQQATNEPARTNFIRLRDALLDRGVYDLPDFPDSP